MPPMEHVVICERNASSIGASRVSPGQSSRHGKLKRNLRTVDSKVDAGGQTPIHENFESPTKLFLTRVVKVHSVCSTVTFLWYRVKDDYRLRVPRDVC
jgi:hypothetical protein